MCIAFKILLILFIVTSIVFANTKMLDKTQEALLSYTIVKDKSDEILEDVKRMTLGEHSDKLLILAPLITGKFEFNASNVSFYYDHKNDQEAGLKYNIKF